MFSRFIRKFCQTEIPISPLGELLVKTPQKGVVWGKGGQYIRGRRIKFKKGEFPSLRRIKKFFEHEQGTDILIYDLSQLGYEVPWTTCMLVSGQSSRHISKMAGNFIKAVKEAEVPNAKNLSSGGHKDLDWRLITFMDIQMHLLTEDLRKEQQIEEALQTAPTEFDQFRSRLAQFSHFKSKKN